MKVKTLKVLEASEGKVLTNGEIYGKVIYLEEGLDESSFTEITDAEYAALNLSAEDGVDV